WNIRAAASSLAACASRKSTVSRAYSRSTCLANRSRSSTEWPGSTGSRLWAIAARVTGISRWATHVPASPSAYDRLSGKSRTHAREKGKRPPLFSPCSVQRRGSTASRADGAIAMSCRSEALEVSIVHRQKAGLGRVAHRPQLASLAGVDGADRHADDLRAEAP